MKITRYLIIISVFILLGSCKKFLDPTSLSTFDSRLIFSNVDDARKATNNIYRQFGEDGYRTRLSITMQANSDVDAGGDRTSDKANYQIIALRAQSNNDDLSKAWNAAYAGIKDCNVVIEGIKASDAFNSPDASIKSSMHQFIGEAYVIRAFWYSQLIYNWGDVPFSIEAPKAGVNFNLAKTDRNVILSTMIQDLIDIEPDMTWTASLPQSVQQVNREFAMGLIARLALQRGGYYLKPDLTKAVATSEDRKKYYTIARDYCLKLMTLKDRPLPADFAQVFKNQCQNIYPSNSDMLFEIPFAITTGEVGYNVGMRVAGGSHPYGTGSHDFAMPISYFYSFDLSDKRRAATCGLFNLDKDLIPAAVASNDIAQAKWSKAYCNPPLGSASAKGTGINWPVMRYADVLLMFAEAENEINGQPTPAAQEAIKRVRRRAFDLSDWGAKVDNYIATVSGNKESFFKALVNERAWEFGGELLRKYDLIRWGIYEQKMQETVKTLYALGDEAVSANPNATHANYLYYRVDSKKITIFPGLYNSNTPPPGFIPSTGKDSDGNTLPLVNGWVRTDWTIALKSSLGVYNAYIDKQFGPYLVSPVRYIMPIPISAIDNSEGLLKNDGYGF
ncbi:RagB/SusD family nutrient uptake outer membrane protein [Pedobacter sp.]|uniref:RagB/SusD family nutrient uptake outer membrane protein n=1 Tax=Pedobacter sp. TaxID=1411316 RepID=UPI003C5C465D